MFKERTLKKLYVTLHVISFVKILALEIIKLIGNMKAADETTLKHRHTVP